MRWQGALFQVALCAFLGVGPAAWRPALASEQAGNTTAAGSGSPAKAVVLKRHADAPKDMTKEISIWEVFSMIKHTIRDELAKNDPSSQWTNAVIGAAFGMFCVCDGESGFMAIMIIIVYMFCCIFAMNQASISWDLPQASLLRRFIGFEAGMFGSMATYYGFDGIKTLLGVVVGWEVAHLCTDYMSDKNYGIIKGQIMYEWFLTIFYTLFICGFVVIFFKEKILGSLLAIFSPILGALLFTASLLYAITEIFIHFHFQQLTPKAAPWIEFVESLALGPLHEDVQDVGPFAGSPYNPTVHGQKLHLDRVIGQAIIVIIAALGMVVQFQFRKQRAAELKKIAEEEQKLRSQRRPSFMPWKSATSSAGEADASGAPKPPLISQDAKGSPGKDSSRCLCFKLKGKNGAAANSSVGATIGTIAEETNDVESSLEKPLLGVSAVSQAPP